VIDWLDPSYCGNDRCDSGSAADPTDPDDTKWSVIHLQVSRDSGFLLDLCARITRESWRPDEAISTRPEDIRDLIARPSMPETYELDPAWIELRECDERRANAIDRLTQHSIREPEPPVDPYYTIRPEPPSFPQPYFTQFDGYGSPGPGGWE
jgi:hypothetical protein